MTDTLIARLHRMGKDGIEYGMPIANEAADRIEELQAKVVQLKVDAASDYRANMRLLAEAEDWKKDQKANFEKIDALQASVGVLHQTNIDHVVKRAAYVNCLEALVSYTEACEGLLNCKPAGQVTNARALLALVAAPQQAEPKEQT